MYWNGHESSPASTTARLVRWVKTVTKSCMGYPAALQRAATRSSCLGTTMFLYPKFCKEVLKNYVNIVKFLQKNTKLKALRTLQTVTICLFPGNGLAINAPICIGMLSFTPPRASQAHLEKSSSQHITKLGALLIGWKDRWLRWSMTRKYKITTRMETKKKSLSLTI